MAEEKKQYSVLQECDIEGDHYLVNDTVFLTDLQAAYRIGLSIEPGPDNRTAPSAIGEHREKSIDVLEETRIMKEPQDHTIDDRAALRRPRSTPAIAE